LLSETVTDQWKESVIYLAHSSESSPFWNKGVMFSLTEENKYKLNKVHLCYLIEIMHIKNITNGSISS